MFNTHIINEESVNICTQYLRTGCSQSAGKAVGMYDPIALTLTESEESQSSAGGKKSRDFSPFNPVNYVSDQYVPGMGDLCASAREFVPGAPESPGEEECCRECREI